MLASTGHRAKSQKLSLSMLTSIVTRFANYIRIIRFLGDADRTLTELNPNNSQILRTFSEFSEFFTNFFRTIIFFGFFFLPCRTKISDMNNSKLYLNHEFLTSLNRTRIIHSMLASTGQGINNF